MRLSVVVITRDEVDRLGDCLDSVAFADERVVLDSGSTDGTVEVAEAAGARVERTDWPGFVAQKNRALAAASGEWILSLDADERLSAEAARELQALLDRPEVVGASFPRANVWLGHPLRHGTWSPDRRVRLVRRDRARWEGDEPHDHLVADGLVVPLTGVIHHDPYRDLGEHLQTIDRYTRLAARALHQRGVRARWWDVVFRPPLHIVKANLLKMAWRDGLAGLVVSGLGAVYTMLKWWRLYQLQAVR